MVVAGGTSAIAIIHASLGVAGRLKNWGEIRRQLSLLTIDIETYQQRMKIDPFFDPEDGAEDFASFRSRYAASLELVPSDLLITKRVRNQVQTDLNFMLGLSDPEGNLNNG